MELTLSQAHHSAPKIQLCIQHSQAARRTQENGGYVRTRGLAPRAPIRLMHAIRRQKGERAHSSGD